MKTGEGVLKSEKVDSEEGEKLLETENDIM